MKKKENDNPFDLTNKKWDSVKKNAKMEIRRNKANAENAPSTRPSRKN